jgi:hypothetical protein
MTKKTAVRKPSRSEQQAHFTLRRSIGLDDHEVTNALDAVRASITADERDIAYFQARLSQSRAALQQDTATAAGLEAVLESRR